MNTFILIGGSGEVVINNENGESNSGILPSSALRLFQSIGALLAVRASIDEKQAERLAEVVIDLNSTVIKELDTTFGEDAKDAVVTYIDNQGGFICGPPGKLPRSLPVSRSWTVQKETQAFAGVSAALLGSYGIDEDTASFLREAIENKSDIRTLFLNPEDAAKEMGIRLRPKIQRQLQFVAEQQQPLSRPEEEVLELANRVVQDGRFISDWAINPRSAAKSLGVRVSEDAFKLIEQGVDLDMRKVVGGRATHNPEVASSVIGIIITVGIAMYSSYEIDRPHVIDRSGLQKF